MTCIIWDTLSRHVITDLCYIVSYILPAHIVVRRCFERSLTVNAPLPVIFTRQRTVCSMFCNENERIAIDDYASLRHEPIVSRVFAGSPCGVAVAFVTNRASALLS